MYYEDSLDDPQAVPAQVPAKFRDPQTGQIRVEALLQSYLELERRLSKMPPPPTIPESADAYAIKQRHDMLASDPDINQRLHQAGFTQDQAQLVYDLAYERVIPMIESLSARHETERHLNQLTQHFGGEARWREVARQLAAWGEANLAPELFMTLSATPDGVIAMHRMMASGEPALGRTAAVNDEAAGEQELKTMMRDPRYWKTRDPAFIEKVSAGYRRLYGE